MITLDDLENYYCDVASYLAREREIEAIFNYNVKSPALDGTGHGSTPGDPTARAVNLKLTLEEENAKLLSKRIEVNEWLEKEVNDELVKAIIRTHYLQHRSWKHTSKAVCNSDNITTSRMIAFRWFEKNNMVK